MGKYPDTVDLRPRFTPKKHWVVLTAFRFHVGNIPGNDGWSAEIPEGFKTDLASTPRFLWPIFPPSGRYVVAAIVHDWLYRGGYVPRAVADGIFLDGMAHAGVKAWKRYVMFLAVRAFGRSSYKG